MEIYWSYITHERKLSRLHSLFSHLHSPPFPFPSPSPPLALSFPSSAYNNLLHPLDIFLLSMPRFYSPPHVLNTSPCLFAPYHLASLSCVHSSLFLFPIFILFFLPSSCSSILQLALLSPLRHLSPHHPIFLYPLGFPLF